MRHFSRSTSSRLSSRESYREADEYRPSRRWFPFSDTHGDYRRTPSEPVDSWRHRRPSSPSLATYGTYIYPARERCLGRSEDYSVDCPCNCCPHSSRCSRDPTRRYSSERSSYRRSASQDRFSIDVVCKRSGLLRDRHGHSFSISIAATATVDDIIDMLTPDGGPCKIVVHWSDGEYQELDEFVSVASVRRHASYLEVKGRKRVHWLV